MSNINTSHKFSKKTQTLKLSLKALKQNEFSKDAILPGGLSPEF